MFTLLKQALTRLENSSKLSQVICFDIASLFRFLLTKEKRFSIGFMSGERGGIPNNEHSICLNASRAFLEFCTGQLSCKKMCKKVFFSSNHILKP